MELQQKRIVLSILKELKMEDGRLFLTTQELSKFVQGKQAEGMSVALVPTMGALHHGHLDLVSQANEIADIVVVSIFVNPKQFNNQEDLEKYPRTLDRDLQLLDEFPDTYVFAPSEEEVYPKNFQEIFLDLGILDEVLEAKFRPGHFKGVVDVVHRLFEIVQPQFALFGKKDLQQLAVVKKLAKVYHPNLTIVPCEIVREENGLASSSRNSRLTEKEFDEAKIIYQLLKDLKKKAFKSNLVEAINMVSAGIKGSTLELEYIEVVDGDSFETVHDWQPGASACIAAYCAGVRLIDNLELVPKAIFC